MKKYYKFGEMILALRKEYIECKQILDELNKCIKIKSKASDFYFSGLLSYNEDKENLNDRKVRLFVEKKYLDILKMIQYLKYDWYTKFLYSAIFDVERKENNLYALKYSNILTPVDSKKYIPKIDIIDQEKFSNLIDELFLSNLMQLKEGYFSNNYDKIYLNFDNAYISTLLGDNSFIIWDGKKDILKYSIHKNSSPNLIEEILSLEMPVDKISSDWLNLLEKYDNNLNRELLFNVDINAQSRKGILEISNIKRNSNNSVVKLIKKSKI